MSLPALCVSHCVSLSPTTARLQVCGLTELAGTGLTGGNLEITTQPHQDTTNNTLGQHRGHKYQARGIQTLAYTTKHHPARTGGTVRTLEESARCWNRTMSWSACPTWGGHLVRGRRWWRWRPANYSPVIIIRMSAVRNKYPLTAPPTISQQRSGKFLPQKISVPSSLVRLTEG